MGGGNGCLRLHFEQFEGANSSCFKLLVDQQECGSPEPGGGGGGATPPHSPPPHPLHPLPMGLIADKIYYHA